MLLNTVNAMGKGGASIADKGLVSVKTIDILSDYVKRHD